MEMLLLDIHRWIKTHLIPVGKVVLAEFFLDFFSVNMGDLFFWIFEKEPYGGLLFLKVSNKILTFPHHEYHERTPIE